MIILSPVAPGSSKFQRKVKAGTPKLSRRGILQVPRAITRGSVVCRPQTLIGGPTVPVQCNFVEKLLHPERYTGLLAALREDRSYQTPDLFYNI